MRLRMQKRAGSSEAWVNNGVGEEERDEVEKY